jgi:death-on-curing protein
MEEAPALMESLANNHPFFDGNKPVAFVSTHTFLLVNAHGLNLEPSEAYEFMMNSIANEEFRFAQILAWLKSHMVQTLLGPWRKPQSGRNRLK